MAWILTPQAKDDIRTLAAEGALRFGVRHSEQYQLSLADTFDTLATHPYMAAPHEIDGLQIRLMPFGRHHILYGIDNEDVVILRVLHGLQNWPDLI